MSFPYGGDPIVDSKVRKLTSELEEAKEAILLLADEIKFLKGEIRLLQQELKQKKG